MGRAGEMLIDVTDGDTIKQVQLEEQIDALMLRITELENKNKMLTSEKLLMFVENKEQKAEIESLTNDVLSYSGKLNIFCAAIACYKDELIKQKNEIAALKHKNNLLKIANKFLHNRIKLGREMFKNHQSTKEQNLKKQIEKAKNDMLSNIIKWIITVLFLLTFVSIVLIG